MLRDASVTVDVGLLAAGSRGVERWVLPAGDGKSGHWLTL
jgi:hypothetical protein